ncbi:hypothetical protein BGZ80_003748 [Entomortierella chlamydospora]|uniref:Protein kinase domain-containing protein n=1 Tax=Entomortierella chlamydospora TaxID=101097 RepID=A0A9P6MMW0_9FUNG|nr:hypothetical protein BGZ80_003748 [Entomortierella chlamydospora]
MSPSTQPCVTAPQLPLYIDNGRLVLHQILGVGAYGSVYRATDTQTGQTYAVKSLNKTGLDSRQRAFQIQEARLHGAVSGHPNIATLHRVIEEDECLHMILDCGSEGDLFYTITEREGFIGNSLAIKSIFNQIARAVMHCHSHGVYHRDLKPENIIMFGESVKLVDFGLATTNETSSDFGCGSTFYLSPECQGGYNEQVKSYDSAANDVWSLGVILINLVFGRNPWKQACLRDDTFAAYVANNDFLQTILPIRGGGGPTTVAAPIDAMAATAATAAVGDVKVSKADDKKATKPDDTLCGNGDKDSGIALRSLE